MIDLVLTDDQYRQVTKAKGAICVRNPGGEPIGLLTPGDADSAPLEITADEVEELNRRMRKKAPRQFTTDEVVERLKSRAGTCDQ